MRDRRAEGRSAPPAHADTRATLRPGCAIVLVDVSAAGALIQAQRQLRPGGRVYLHVVTASQRIGIAAHVLRCLVWALDPIDGVTYRAALHFDGRIDWCWAEPTRHVKPLPEHARPAGTADEKRLPGEVVSA